MTITVADLDFLASSEGDNLLARLANEDLSEANTLRLVTRLRKDNPAEQVRAALEMARLRVKGAEKFGEDAGRMFFTREALEQASDPLIRGYRAGKILSSHSESKPLKLIDACCGIGADALAFAHSGMDVIGLDMDAVRVEIARHNAAILGLKAQFEVADIRDGLPDGDVAFFDPARRDELGNRIFNVEMYQPPLSTIRSWEHKQVVVKLSPGVDLAQLANYDGCVEFISVNGDLKEAVLWQGEAYGGRRATLLTGDGVHHWDDGDAGNGERISAPKNWLVEPDPALLRAGVVQAVAQAFEGWQLDPTIAYFTTDIEPKSPWLRAWQILDWMPFNVKKLRAYLREQHVGTVTVKKRGSAVTPEALIPQLKLKGDESRTVVLTLYQGQPIMLVCADYKPKHSN